MAIYRILVLGVTFLLVGLCPSVQPALMVFAMGIAIYISLWLYEGITMVVFGKQTRPKTRITTCGSLDRYFEIMEEYPMLFRNAENTSVALVVDREVLEREQAAMVDVGALLDRPPHYYTLGVLSEDELQIYLRKLVRCPDGLLIPFERRVFKSSLRGRPYVVIIPHHGEKILLTRCLFLSSRRWEWTTPLGYLHANEGFFELACRELAETTGHRAVNIRPLFRMRDDDTSVFIAEISSARKTVPSRHTVGESRWFSLSELEQRILRGTITDPDIMAALIYFRRHGFTSKLLPVEEQGDFDDQAEDR